MTPDSRQSSFRPTFPSSIWGSSEDADDEAEEDTRSFVSPRGHSLSIPVPSPSLSDEDLQSATQRGFSSHTGSADSQTFLAQSLPHPRFTRKRAHENLAVDSSTSTLSSRVKRRKLRSKP